MLKKVVLFFALLALPLLLSACQVGSESKTILFYGIGCPHCENVDEYVKANNIEATVSFTKKEVFSNKGNSSLMTDKAKICGLDTNTIGVPFLWNDGKCYVGDEPIINFFASQVGSGTEK